MSQGTMAGRGVIVALIVGVLIYGLAMGATYPLLGIMLSQQVTGLWNGINASAMGLGFLVGAAIVSAACRWLGAGRTALLGVFLMALSLTGLALTRDFWLLFAARVLLGCGANLLFVVAETALNLFSASAQRGRVMGLYTAATAFGFVVGPAVVAVLPDRPSEILLVCAAVTILAVLPLLPARAPLDRSVRPASATRVLPSVLALPFAFGFLIVASAIDALVIALLPVIALGQNHPVESGALFVAVFHLGLLLGQPLVGLALDRAGRRRTVLGCCAICLGCTVALVFGDEMGFWAVALIMFFWGGANYGLYTAGLALIGDRFLGEALTAATTAFAGVYALATIAAPIWAGGMIDSAGAVGVYAATAGLYLAATVWGAMSFRPQEPTLV